MRQQRANSARGQVQLANKRIAPDVAWSPSSIDGNNVYFDLDTPVNELLIVGVPRVNSSSSNTYPTAAAFVGEQLQLTYAAPQTAPTTFDVQFQDPGVRTRFGGYLGKAEQTMIASPQPTAAVEPVNWVISTLIPNGARIDIAPATTATVMMPQNAFRNQATSELANTVSIGTASNHEIEVTWPTGIATGDTMVVEPVLLATSQDGAGWTVLAPGTAIAP